MRLGFITSMVVAAAPVLVVVVACTEVSTGCTVARLSSVPVVVSCTTTSMVTWPPRAFRPLAFFRCSAFSVKIGVAELKPPAATVGGRITNWKLLVPEVTLPCRVPCSVRSAATGAERIWAPTIVALTVTWPVASARPIRMLGAVTLNETVDASASGEVVAAASGPPVTSWAKEPLTVVTLAPASATPLNAIAIAPARAHFVNFDMSKNSVFSVF